MAYLVRARLICHKVFDRTVRIRMGSSLWSTLCEVTVALGGVSFYWSFLVEVLAVGGVGRL